MARKRITAVQKWDEELAKYAVQAAAQEESTAIGSFFSLRGGQLSFADSPIPNNQMAVVIIDSIIENVFYPGQYNPEEPQGPMCFAFGRLEKELIPHESVTEAQSDDCVTCPNNQWGSAQQGRGKACRNTRRLALLPAGTLAANGALEEAYDLDHFKSAQVGFMKLPVTSVKGFANYVKTVSVTLKRPPFAIFTRISVVPDPKTQFRVIFEPLKEVPNTMLQVLIGRHEEVKQMIDFPYQPAEELPESKTKVSRRKTAAKKKTASRKKRY